MPTSNKTLLSIGEQQNITALIEGCGHRSELRNTLRNIHNYSNDVNPELGSLLRYIDSQQLEGLITIMRLFSRGKPLEQILLPEQFTAVWK
ncbi:hypothetical protein AB6D92_17760 [Vibrio splendidus]|nr:hypothetical protein [Vibrio splendidus]MCC4882340.1 hypothetical protein [Vibrio splendidus]